LSSSFRKKPFDDFELVSIFNFDHAKVFRELFALFAARFKRLVFSGDKVDPFLG